MGPPAPRADLGAQIFAFEFMNEPDFVVEEWERDLSARVARPLRFEILAELVSRFSALVHRHTPAFSTMAAARLHNLWAWDDEALGIDLLQVHSYPDTNHPNRDADVFGMRAASLGMAKPVVLGEFPGNGPQQRPAGVVSAAHDARGVPGVCGGRRIRRRLALELQRHRRVWPASGGAAARVRPAASGAREPPRPAGNPADRSAVRVEVGLDPLSYCAGEGT